MNRMKTLLCMGIWMEVLAHLFCGPSFAQLTRLNKNQIPSSTVHSDQSNTFSVGDQNFGSAASLTDQNQRWSSPCVRLSDCNTTGKVGHLYARLTRVRRMRLFLSAPIPDPARSVGILLRELPCAWEAFPPVHGLYSISCPGRGSHR